MGSFSLTHWIIFAGMCWLVWRVFFRRNELPSSPQVAPDRPAPVTYAPDRQPTYQWPALGEFAAEVSGESHYQEALRDLAGPHGSDGVDVQYTAHLIPESANRHDPDAVRVDIQGKTVGYLPQGDATTFRERLETNGLGTSATACLASIIGGYTAHTGEKRSYGVRLDIEPLE